MFMRTLFSLAALSLVSTNLLANSPTDDLKAFPQAQNGMLRHVIRLTPQTNENLFKVEIIPGKTIEKDCNNTFFMGDIEEETVKGWGYTYYVVEDIKGPASTMMACPDNTKTKAFVPVATDDGLVRYNSKLPLVIYAPKDVEVRYRIWQAAETSQAAKTE
ncbi:serine protease inhibitor ecotin [Pseudomonas sp. F1_0610]|uniref:serine protease inhibitor ecotin n=1 Tax=Pseudomonas sp. F1_0610 TaxID=3114284 RepID=UPI0039C3E95D